MFTGSGDSSQLGGPIRIAKITGQVAEFGFGMNPKARLRGNILEDEKAEYLAYRNYSRGEIAECNWLQLQENAMDPVHTNILHG